MHKLLRYYSQNRIKVWTIILGVIFIIMIIQVLNNVAKEELQYTNEKETESNVVSYRNESKSIISDGSVSKYYREEFGNIIDKFYTYCVNHQPEKAYELVAPDTKRILYPTESQFENLYYKEKFEGNKEYSFQSWSQSADDIYIYQVKIFENMLATGKAGEYIEDYITIVPVGDSYKLNINSYIGRKSINKQQDNDILTAEVAVADVYLNYEIYTIRIKNNTDQKFLLDTRKKTNTTYITDNNGNKFEAFLYEVAKDDLIFEPRELKTIQVKFNRVYNSENKVQSINFTDIVNYEEYEKTDEVKKNTLKINI